MSSTSRPFNPFVSLGMAVDASVGVFRSLGQSVPASLVHSPRAALGRGRRAGRGPKAPNPAGTKLARKARIIGLETINKEVAEEIELEIATRLQDKARVFVGSVSEK